MTSRALPSRCRHPEALGGISRAAGAHRGAAWRRPRRAAGGAWRAASLPGSRPCPAGQAHPRNRRSLQRGSGACGQRVWQPPQRQPVALCPVWAAQQRGSWQAGRLARLLGCSCPPRHLLQPLFGNLPDHSHRRLPRPSLRPAQQLASAGGVEMGQGWVTAGSPLVVVCGGHSLPLPSLQIRDRLCGICPPCSLPTQPILTRAAERDPC